MTTIEQEQERFSDLANNFQAIWERRITLQIIKDGDWHAVVNIEHIDRCITLMSESAETIYKCLSDLNKKLEARLNGKVE